MEYRGGAESAYTITITAEVVLSELSNSRTRFANASGPSSINRPAADAVLQRHSVEKLHYDVNWIAADILRIENDILVEHWDVIQDEATRASSKSGRPMFGEKFARAS